MLKKLFLTLLIGFVFAATPTLTFAHTLKSDGSIGAVIHIDPEDDPIIGEPANFFFEFKDKENKFAAEECSCLVTITKGEQELFSEQLDTSSQNPSLNSSSFSFTFPEKGVYQIKVTGYSIDAGSFDPFELTYDLRVERESSGQTETSFFEDNLHFIILGTVLIIFLSIVFSKKIKKNSPDSAVSSKTLLLLLFVTASLLLHTLQLSVVIFSHQQPNHQENTHPCCLPQPIVLETHESFLQPIFVSSEMTFSTSGSYVAIIELNIRSRAPPVTT